MRRFASIMAALIASVALLPTPAVGSALADRLSKPATAIFTIEHIRTQKTTSRTIRVYKVFDRHARLAGNYILVCWYAGQGGVLGSGISHCSGSIRLARGVIIVEGPIHIFSFHELAVTGGTGFYAGADGVMNISPGKGHLNLMILSLWP